MPLSLVTQTTSDPDDTLTLIEDASSPTLRRAYWRLGGLQWTEELLQKSLKRHELVEGPVWKERLSDSTFRLNRIRDLSKQLRDILKLKGEL